MGIVHKATLKPSKTELIADWLASQPWGYKASNEWERTGSFRFDDPAGEVGVETLIVSADGGSELQVPLTYRAEPLADAEAFLIGTLEHSALGTRWVYDATGDPVYAQTVASTVATGGSEVETFRIENGEKVVTPKFGFARGSGKASAGFALPASIETTTNDDVTTIVTPEFTVFVVRRVGDAVPADSDETLTAQWADHSTPVTVVGLSFS